LGKKSGFPVYVGLDLFSQKLTNGAIPVLVKGYVKICKDVYSTGELDGTYNGLPKNEQSLIIDTPDGLVVITGCAHSGIVNILKKSKEILNKNIYLVLGGFHLLNSSDDEIKQIIKEFKSLGVKKCGATHCTGDNAIALFKEAYGQDYIPMGVGKVFQLSSNPLMVKEQMGLLTAFHLGEARPNPFNPSATIEYFLPKDVQITLEIHNISGQKIATVDSGRKSAGKHTVVWDARGLPSGVYFYTLRAGDYVNTGKALLMK